MKFLARYERQLIAATYAAQFVVAAIIAIRIA